MNTSWQRAAVTLAVVTLGLTACGDGDEPTQSTSPSPTSSASASSSMPSPSASPTPSGAATAAAEVPATARARTEAGAIAFLDFYFDQINRGLVNPSAAPDLFAIADKECVACKNGQKLFAEYADGGWSVKQPGIRVEDAALATAPTAAKVIVNFTFVEMSQPLFQNGKKTEHSVPAARTKKGAALTWVNGGWQMFGIENL